MANEEHLKILRQGTDAWNRWRVDDLTIEPDLSGASLEDLDLSGANLEGADLRDADSYLANLEGSNLKNARLAGAHLGSLDYCNLEGANLWSSFIAETLARHASFERADLNSASFQGSDLSAANFRNADLAFTNFDRAVLCDADFSGANLFAAIFGDNDLSLTKGLDSVTHTGPSTVGVNTLYRSAGNLTEDFLRGCGLSDVDIEYAKLAKPGLTNEEISDITYRIHHLKATQALQISRLFISYSTKDSSFVDALEPRLNSKGIRSWRDSHAAVAGRLETQIDRAIRLNPTFLLVLSERSVESDWVEHEVRKARQLEKDLKRDVICPIALDATWKNCRWPARLREQIMEYNILDFSSWRDKALFDQQFKKLTDGLQIFYGDAKARG